MNSPLPRGALVAFLLAFLAAGSAFAQRVEGRLTERETGLPIPGVVIRLLTLQGDSKAGALTDASGAFTLSAPAPGRFRLRVERVGFESELSEVLDLVGGQVKAVPLVIRSRPITLEGITVRGRSRGCAIRENGDAVARVWEEARKALGVLALTQSAKLVHFDTESFHREFDPVTKQLLGEERRSSFDRTGSPFQSIPVEELQAKGYIRSYPDSTIYYAPDARVLLSDEFLDGHCFGLTSGAGPNEASLGLEFRPVRGISRPDIEGTLWLDAKTSELRFIDYHYVGYGFDVSPDRLGGRIEFERVLPSGAWIVRRWVIRMPVVTLHRQHWQSATGRPQETTTTTVKALAEEGGEVVTVSTSGSTRKSAGRSTLSGVVVDSLAGRPLPGAVVYLSGTSLADTTDAAGEFRIFDVPGGRYVVSFMHPDLRARGILPLPQRIEVAPPSPATVNLAIPSVGSLLHRYCPTAASTDEGMLVGHVNDGRTGKPLSGAHVRVSWVADSRLRTESLTRGTRSGTVTSSPDNAKLVQTTGEAESEADGSGLYRLCGIPVGKALEVEAVVGRSSSHHRVEPDGNRLRVQDLAIEAR